MKKSLCFSFLSFICCISSYSSEETSYLNGNSTNLQQTSLNGYIFRSIPVHFPAAY